MKNRYYDTVKRGQAVYVGENPPSNLIKDDDSRVKNFFEPTPEGFRKAYTEDGLPFNDLIPEHEYIEPEPTKEQLLNNLIVTITNGKRFYADPESRTDLMAVVIEGQALGLPDTTVLENNWKTPDGIISVTLGDIREASSKALEEKAKIIGVIE